MRVLVIYAHPVETSLSAALHEAVVGTLRQAGHDVDDCDLNAEGFAAVLTRQERLDYHDLAINRAPVETYVARLLAAQALVLVHPVWNHGLPAILKGYLDRVFLPGVSFRMEDGKVAPNLTNISRVAVVTTYGGTRWRAFLLGDPARKIAKRFYRAIFRTVRPVLYLAKYDMNNATREGCTEFIEKVKAAMRGF